MRSLIDRNVWVRLARMRRYLPLALLFFAGAAKAESILPERACADAAQQAEQRFGLPSGLLLAIGQVESGRQTSEGRRPWPWSINAEGIDYVSETMDGAIANVRTMQSRGIQSIDTGCFQINLMFHPDAFPTLETAFDPQANATYAAQFLTELRGRTASWGEAVANYHSATPWRGEAYRQLVWQAWLGIPAQPGMGLLAGRGVQVFVPTGSLPARPGGETSIVSGGGGRGPAFGVTLIGRQRNGLPVVYRPHAAP